MTILRALSALSMISTPLLVLQGRWVRQQTPHLPEAGAPMTGQTPGVGTPASVLVIGESTVAGVGVKTHEDGLSGQFALAWAERLGRPVRWTAVGKNGVTAKSTRRILLPRVPPEPFDLIVVVLGVNDTKDLTPVPRWRRELQALFGDLRARTGPAPLLISGVPPMAQFPVLPPPLRQFLGLRAAVMDEALREIVRRTPDASWVGGFGSVDPSMFCEDRFHPGPTGYAAWGAQLAAQAPLLPAHATDLIAQK